ncbi:hypothetical protein CTAYLR_008163 [Chrysophaeum taylorii]|uniref:Alpha/beta hydrolase n=1 Tax=Chrysophaeum taylorii TaxID=2483200 RepID=A0AAD7UJH1_9STRA|nr:hypothetical protein CTAYLR_008163 [Chrysophaeum taylorii]
MLPLPKPRVPARASNTSGISTTTRDVRGDVLSSLLSGTPSSSKVLTPQARAVRDEVVSQESAIERSVFRGPSLRSVEPIRRRQPCVEVVATQPGAIEVSIESWKQHEHPVLTVSRVNDESAIADDGGTAGLAVVAVARRRHVALQPPPPASLDVVLSQLGRSARRDQFPAYVHLCDAAHYVPPSLVTPRAAPEYSETWLQQVIVATNRKPIVDEEGLARFSPTLDDSTTWGIATIAIDEGFRGPLIGDIQKFRFVSWEPLARDRALHKLSHAASLDGDCLVYVHGFNTNLQFAARSAALYSRAFDRPTVVCFAWPSNPPLPKTWAISAVLSVAERNYTAAEQMLQRSVPVLAATAKLVRDALPRQTHLHWKAHSMGCYLVLAALDAVLQENNASRVAQRVVLDAPDTPTWFFQQAIARTSAHDVRFLHYFNPNDEPVELARQRRGLDYPAPGNGCVTAGQLGVQSVDCSNAKASYGNHDYGRIDPLCLADQRDFLKGTLPENRHLLHDPVKPGLWQIPPSR